MTGPPARVRLPYSAEGYTEVYHREREVYSLLSEGQDRVIFWNPGMYPKLPAKLGSVFGIRSVDDYENMNLRRHSEYFGFLIAEMQHMQRAFPGATW